ncbi:MAG: hypothetical protein JST10_00580 [Bacteroidetes bacterium]|nr:hypothetical protein [Bacteroidota bacterium]MBS1631045.1 hypothetical protein [Bacteroidota bacterium]
MKRKYIVHANEQARMYHQYYKPSLNVFRLLKSVLAIFLSGSSPVAGGYSRRK